MSTGDPTNAHLRAEYFVTGAQARIAGDLARASQSHERWIRGPAGRRARPGAAAAPQVLDLVDQLDLRALMHDLVDLDHRGGAGEVELGEQVADEVEAEQIEAARCQPLGDGGDGLELARGRVEGADARALVEVGQARAGAGDPRDAAEDPPVHHQDP